MILINIPGRFFVEKTNHLKNDKIILARTPYICKIDKYGESVNINGLAHKELCYWSSLHNRAELILNGLFDFNLKRVTNYKSIDLINSNLLVHSTRLFILFKDNNGYLQCPAFYRDWCLETSKLLIKCDNELQTLIKIINERDNSLNDYIYVKPILEHYESIDAVSLTDKIASINAFKKGTPSIYINKKYYADFSHRYFQEELIGLRYVINLANKYNLDIANIDVMYKFFIKYCT